jgi:hypothetical protein
MLLPQVMACPVPRALSVCAGVLCKTLKHGVSTVAKTGQQLLPFLSESIVVSRRLLLLLPPPPLLFQAPPLPAPSLPQC